MAPPPPELELPDPLLPLPLPELELPDPLPLLLPVDPLLLLLPVDGGLLLEHPEKKKTLAVPKIIVDTKASERRMETSVQSFGVSKHGVSWVAASAASSRRNSSSLTTTHQKQKTCRRRHFPCH